MSVPFEDPVAFFLGFCEWHRHVETFTSAEERNQWEQHPELHKEETE